MADNCCQTLIIGASFYGMALAKCMNDALLIERGYRIGTEFSASLRVNRFSGDVHSDFGKHFLDGIKKHRLIDETGAVYSAPAAYLLADMTRGVNAVFATELLSVKKAAERYEVTIFNSEGKKIIYAERIIDTTAVGAVRAGISGIKKKLNVILSSPKSAQTVYDSFTEGNVFGFDAGLSEAMPEVRRRLYNYLEAGQGAVLIADEFDYEMPRIFERLEKDYLIIPSVGFNNPIEAADAGGGGITYEL